MAAVPGKVLPSASGDIATTDAESKVVEADAVKDGSEHAESGPASGCGGDTDKASPVTDEESKAGDEGKKKKRRGRRGKKKATPVGTIGEREL